ncbi:MAG TPA: RNA polymerase sigma factor [Candidatus Hydrogenedentes bacterium]|nr:MAG: ECF RNA polymerase sigma factor SigH [Candidatus Hydrogenedentes bacterium ADurb.Bin179]HOH28165.1 RNA polymerase sigma factor [Candidatus Hydrogenedentota bacterium]
MENILENIEKYRDQLYRFVLRNVWDSSAADDVFSSAILAVYENRDKYIPGTNFRAWMYKILTNKCFAANRETKRVFDRIDEDDAEYIAQDSASATGFPADDPKDFLEQCGDEVYKAFQHLSTAQRSCIFLKDVEGFSYREIAEILGIPTATVMTHLARGRVRLRKELYHYAKEHGIIRSPVKLALVQRGTETLTPGSMALQ